MTEQITAMRYALNFILATGEHDQNCGAFDLDEEGRHYACTCGLRKTIDALRTAIEAVEKQEPFGWYDMEHGEIRDVEWTKQKPKYEGVWKPLYTTPPQRTEQEPVAFPRQAGDSTWIIDTAFIWRVKHTIDPNTPYDWTPSEEQIETVLLALEKIPSPLYTTPPAAPVQEKADKPLSEDFGLPKPMRTPPMPDVKPPKPAPEQEPVACTACEGDPKAGNIPCCICGATPPQRTWVGLTDKEAMQICVDCGCLSEDWLVLLYAIEAKLRSKNEY